MRYESIACAESLFRIRCTEFILPEAAEVATSRSFLQVVLTAVGESVKASARCSRGLINSFFGAIDMSHIMKLPSLARARRLEARFGDPDTGKRQVPAPFDAAAIAVVATATTKDYCSNTCNYAADGNCDDGGPGFEYYICNFGTDCIDCGQRSSAQYTCIQPPKWCSAGSCAASGTTKCNDIN